MNPYISDILSQPSALREAAKKYSPDSLTPLVARFKNGEFDRIVITGMGASYNAAYPAYLELTRLAIPVILVNAAELVHYLGGQIGPRTLLWANSQSGRSAELLHLIELIKSAPPACTLACVNDESSPLAAASDICLPIHAGLETTVSTKTYINTVAVNLLTANYLIGEDVEALKKEIILAAYSMEAYLEDWRNHVNTLNNFLGEFETLMIIGRGASMSAVWNGALINKEAAKFPLEGMNAADFRHGPLELALPGFAALIFAGSATTLQLNRRLALDIIENAGHVFWLDIKNDPALSTILIPNTDESIRPLVEILPMQMLTLVLANRKGVIPGQFRVIEKVTEIE